MPSYMVRVELKNANGEDYNELHEKLGALGLARSVIGNDGASYEMPTGTYYGKSDLSTGSLRERVSTLSNPHSRPGVAAVFVAEVSDWAFWLYKE